MGRRNRIKSNNPKMTFVWVTGFYDYPLSGLARYRHRTDHAVREGELVWFGVIEIRAVDRISRKRIDEESEDFNRRIRIIHTLRRTMYNDPILWVENPLVRRIERKFDLDDIPVYEIRKLSAWQKFRLKIQQWAWETLVNTIWSYEKPKHKRKNRPWAKYGMKVNKALFERSRDSLVKVAEKAEPIEITDLDECDYP